VAYARFLPLVVVVVVLRHLGLILDGRIQVCMPFFSWLASAGQRIWMGGQPGGDVCAYIHPLVVVQMVPANIYTVSSIVHDHEVR
jgi:hypothetical protein